MNKVENLPPIWVGKDFEQAAKKRAASLGGLRLTEYIRHLAINDIQNPQALKTYDCGAGSKYTPPMRTTPELKSACDARAKKLFGSNLTEYLRQLMANDLVKSGSAKFKEIK